MRIVTLLTAYQSRLRIGLARWLVGIGYQLSVIS
jgi:hypothetical protein